MSRNKYMYFIKFSLYTLLLIFILHSILYYYDVDVLEIIQNNFYQKDNNIEENIKILQHNLRELSDQFISESGNSNNTEYINNEL